MEVHLVCQLLHVVSSRPMIFRKSLSRETLNVPSISAPYWLTEYSPCQTCKMRSIRPSCYCTNYLWLSLPFPWQPLHTHCVSLLQVQHTFNFIQNGSRWTHISKVTLTMRNLRKICPKWSWSSHFRNVTIKRVISVWTMASIPDYGFIQITTI